MSCGVCACLYFCVGLIVRQCVCACLVFCVSVWNTVDVSFDFRTLGKMNLSISTPLSFPLRGAAEVLRRVLEQPRPGRGAPRDLRGKARPQGRRAEGANHFPLNVSYVFDVNFSVFRRGCISLARRSRGFNDFFLRLQSRGPS